MEAKKLNNLSIPEYIEIERAADTKYEYHDGRVVAMAGGTLEHGLISGNIFGEIKFRLRDKKNNCRAMNSDIKLHIQTANKFLYPDAMILCGEIKKSTADPNAVMNPTVIIEVLSKSTESYDRGDEFFAYRQIISLQEYILVDQYKAQVEIYQRQSDLWKITRITGIDQRLDIPSLGIAIDLESIYEDIVFDE